MSKKQELIKRLQDVSKNNTAYVEAFGGAQHWGQWKKEIESLPLKKLEIEVEKLEKALEDVAEREEIKMLRKENAKLKAQNKLEELGLSIDDLRELL